MVEFLRLPIEEQQEILTAMAATLGRNVLVLQKDVWLCWVLREIFKYGNNTRMAFKGGTSLSKVFKAIDRFSEDIDITIDYRDISDDKETDPFSPDTSNNARKRFNEQLSTCLQEYVQDAVVPQVRKSFSEITNNTGDITLSDNGEELRLYYPTTNNTNDTYMSDCILVEFGGRNVTEPGTLHHIVPVIAEKIPDLIFPEAYVMVLAPERTFWEKATLIHVECHRQRQLGVERISRHWYDLVMLSRGMIGKCALSQRNLLEEVVRHKTVFFNASYAHYHLCLEKGLILMPQEPLLSNLRKDYTAMNTAGMFDSTPPSFDTLLDEIQLLQEQING
jgi:hypothetical protein